MKNREFRGDRVLKAAKIIVSAITIFTLFFGTFGLVRFKETRQNYLNKFDQCGGSMAVCGFWLDAISGEKETTFLYLKIGIGLPVFFYGGLYLYNYLFPKRHEEKE